MTFQAFAEAYLIPAQLAFAMLGMGLTLSVKDFVNVFKTPAGIAIGLVMQVIMVPLIALAFTVIFDLSEGWAVGLLLISVVPGGAFSNLLTFLGKGNTPLSISLTVIATAACIVTVPLILSVVASSHLPADFAFPTLRIVRDIFLFLLLPLAIGMVLLRMLEPHAERLSKFAIRAALILLATIVVSSLGSGRIKVWEYGFGPPLLVILFGVILAVLVPHACRLLGRYDDDTVAIGIEVTVRNIGVALLIFPFFFPGTEAQGHVLFSCLFYSGLSAFLAIPQLLLHRAGRSPVIGRRPKPRPETEGGAEGEG